MDNVIEKTKKLIEVIDSSELIIKLDYYKNRVIINSVLMNLIKKYNNSDDHYEKMFLKEKIYSYEDYKLYMNYYNDLFYYVLKINNKLKKYTVGGCANESH